MPDKKNIEAYGAPLKPRDTVNQTVGCRHSEPSVCSKHSMPKVCAFVQQDGICSAPPKSWSKLFAKLKQQFARK